MSQHDGDGQHERDDGGLRDHGQADDDARDLERALSQAAPDDVTSHWVRDMARLAERVLERMDAQGQADLHVFRCISIAATSLREAMEYGGIDDDG